MTVVRQSELENLDGFQVDYDQFLPYSLGCDFVDAFLLPLRDACEAGDRLSICAIVWFMLLANEMPVPSRTNACQCKPGAVRRLISNRGFEARCGEAEDLHEVLIQVARAAGIYGRHFFRTKTARTARGIGPPKR